MSKTLYIACDNQTDAHDLHAALHLGADLLPATGEDMNERPEEERAERIRGAALLIAIAPTGPIVQHALDVAAKARIPSLLYVPPHRSIPITSSLDRVAAFVREIAASDEDEE